MKFLLLFIIAILPLAAEPRIAIVDLEKVIADFYLTAQINEEFAQKEKVLEDSARFQVVKEADAKLRELAVVIRDSKRPEHERKRAAEEFESVNIEYRSLVREFQEFLDVERKRIRRERVDRLEELLASIRATVERLSAVEGYDLTLETGGNTSSQVPAIIYLRSGTDISELVIAELNKEKGE